MAIKCRTPQRNFCALNGRIAVLFVDIDGTAMVCQPYFDSAISQFVTLMELLSFPRELARRVLHETYYGTMPKRGFDRGHLGEGIIEAYHALCAGTATDSSIGLPCEQPRKDIEEILQMIGNAPFFRSPQLFPNVLPVLTRARHNFFLISVTIGNREVQKYKIKQGGLDAVFDDMIITLNENKAELVRELIVDYQIDPKHSAFIGNSIRSDGATLTETNFVYLPLETSLSYPNDSLPEDTQFDVFKADNWHEVEERAINRLVRRRRVAMDSGDGDICHK